jgi:ubiquinone/menaquinone biosynthesis C-methylase UbiE
VIRGEADIRRAYTAPSVASTYIDERFREPLGAMLHARQARALRRTLAAHAPKRVLEIAPGPARLTTEVAPHFDGMGAVVDTSAAMFAEARRRLEPIARGRWHYIQANAFDLPFAGPFDLVYSFRLIRHFDVEDRARLYAQVRRVLRPGGLLVFDAVNADVFGPFRRRAGEAAFKHYDAMLTADDVTSELQRAGFDVVSLEGVERRYPLLYQLQVLVAPRSRPVARLAMEAVDRFGGGAPLEWVVTCRRK